MHALSMSCADGSVGGSPNQSVESGFARAWRMCRRYGSYSFPRDLGRELEAKLRPYPNRVNAGRLAHLLFRVHRYSTQLFPIVRQGLCKLWCLGLTEKQVRNATRTLEEIGFVVRIAGGEFRKAVGKCAVVLFNLGDWARVFTIQSGPTGGPPGPLEEEKDANNVSASPKPAQERPREAAEKEASEREGAERGLAALLKLRGEIAVPWRETSNWGRAGPGEDAAVRAGVEIAPEPLPPLSQAAKARFWRKP